MRHELTICAMLALAATPPMLSAQHVGVKSGVSFGDVSNTGVLPDDVGVRSGFTIGVSAFTPGVLAVGVEGLFSQRGVSSQAGFRSRKLEYLDFPVLLRVNVPASGVSPYAYAGPQLSYELTCNSGEGNCPRGDRPRYPKAGIIGAGIALGGDATVSIEGRYVYGFDDLDLDQLSADSFRDRSLMLLAGIAF